jgi:cobaltochelatase CobN
MYQEIASRYDNPDWIKGMMKEGYSGARYMSNKFVTNLYGWQVTRPSAVSDDLWNRVYDTYFNDKYNLGVTDWLKSGNNAYSFISMGGTMLTSIKEGYWNANDATIRNIANSWAQATVTSGVACCDCSCGNIAMMQWAIQYVNPDILAQLLPKLYEATRNPVFLNNTQNAQPQDVDDTSNVDPSSPNPQEGSDSSSTVPSNATTNTQSSSKSSSNAQNSGNSQGQAASNVGTNGQTGSSQGRAASNTGEASEISEVNDVSEAGDSSSQGADVKKSIEINPITSQSASEVGLSIIAVIGILCLIGVIGLGYFRNRDEEEKINDLDELYNEKII